MRLHSSIHPSVLTLLYMHVSTYKPYTQYSMHTYMSYAHTCASSYLDSVGDIMTAKLQRRMY